MKYKNLNEVNLDDFLEILNTGNVSILRKSKNLNDAKENWTRLKAEYDKLDPDNSIKETFDRLVKIATSKTMYNAIQLTIKTLRYDRDQDLENQLREFGFKLTEADFIDDLDTIKNESQILLIIIHELEAGLPMYLGKPATTPEEVLKGYCSITDCRYESYRNISVLKYCEIKRAYDNALESMKRIIDKLKN